jgi:hypothetical protein
MNGRRRNPKKSSVMADERLSVVSLKLQNCLNRKTGSKKSAGRVLDNGWHDRDLLAARDCDRGQGSWRSFRE